MPRSPWPFMMCLLIVAGLIAGVEALAIDAGLDGIALSSSIGALGVIAGIIGRSA